MEIVVKPYEAKYRKGVVRVLSHLWPWGEKERYERFDWLYESNSNPSFNEPLGVVAVDEADEVIGFRGWVPGIVWQNSREYIIARAADVVVSPKARRQGVFSKMTNYSLTYLRNKGIDAILNLSSNSQSNPGYIKLGWKPVCQINIWYKPMLFHRSIVLTNEISRTYKGNVVTITPYIPKGLKLCSDDSLCFSLNEGQLDWYAQHPNTNYLTAVSYNGSRELTSLIIFDNRGSNSNLLFQYHREPEVAEYAYKCAIKYISSSFISTWGWALSKDDARFLRRIGFIRVPFYEYIRKKPPILVRSIGNVEENSGWKIGLKDIRDIHNWCINMLDYF